MNKVKPTRADISAIHSIAVKIESLRKQYGDLSDSFRESLDDEFELENQFLNVLGHLEIIASDISNIAEERNGLVLISDIEWDVDEIEDLVNLPSEVLIEPERVDDAADYLSDEYGYCVKSFVANFS